MIIIAKKTLALYYQERRDAETALEEWYEKVERAKWNTFADVRQSFNSADYVGNNRIVFNIKGNKYRLVALVLFNNKMVYIRFIGTHEEYSRINDINKI